MRNWKLATLALATLAAIAAFADDIILSTQRADGSANLWTAADAADALGLMNRRYWREMATESGRVAWHGAITNRVANPAALEILDYHEDAGFVWTNRYTQEEYDRVMASRSGRVKWHGAMTLYSVNTNDLTVAETYADGYIWSAPWTTVTPEDSVEIANRKRLKAATLSGGQPAALRAARARRLEETSPTNTVTVIVTP